MNNSSSLSPAEQTVTDLAHLAWCALISLRLAQQDGQALSTLTIHSFLLRWLASAQKHRHFPRSVAPDIDNLLRLGRQKGPTAGLHQRLESLWLSYNNPPVQKSDLLRLAQAIEQLKSRGWINSVVSDEEWLPGELWAEYTETMAFLVKKSALIHQFNEDGRQIGPVDFLIVGDRRVVWEVLERCELHYVRKEEHGRWCSITLLSDL